MASENTHPAVIFRAKWRGIFSDKWRYMVAGDQGFAGVSSTSVVTVPSWLMSMRTVDLELGWLRETVISSCRRVSGHWVRGEP